MTHNETSWVIMSALSNHFQKSADHTEYRYWNGYGWRPFNEAQIYTDDERYSSIPPRAGRWVRLVDVEATAQNNYNLWQKNGII